MFVTDKVFVALTQPVVMAVREGPIGVWCSSCHFSLSVVLWVYFKEETDGVPRGLTNCGNCASLVMVKVTATITVYTM